MPHKRSRDWVKIGIIELFYSIDKWLTEISTNKLKNVGKIRKQKISEAVSLQLHGGLVTPILLA